MAKNWIIDKEKMVRTYADGVKNLTVNPGALFDDFAGMETVKQQIIINGLQQKLDDTIARSKDMQLTEAEKREAQSALWDRLYVDREWNMPSAEKGPRGPSVSLANLIPAINEFVKLGWTIEAIAGMLGKPADLIARYVNDGKEEEITEE